MKQTKPSSPANAAPRRAAATAEARAASAGAVSWRCSCGNWAIFSIAGFLFVQCITGECRAGGLLPRKTFLGRGDLRGQIVPRLLRIKLLHGGGKRLGRWVAEGRADLEFVEQVAQSAGFAGHDWQFVRQRHERHAALGDKLARVRKDDGAMAG